jgi:hypothetical protein
MEYARKKKTSHKCWWSHLLYPLTRTRSTALVLLPKSSVRIPVVRFGTPPLPCTQASVYLPLPLVPGGGGHNRSRGGGGSQFGRGDRHCGTLGILGILGILGRYMYFVGTGLLQSKQYETPYAMLAPLLWLKKKISWDLELFNFIKLFFLLTFGSANMQLFVHYV